MLLSRNSLKYMALMTTLCSFMVVCDKDHSPTKSEDNVNAEDNRNEYFPLALGNSWTYDNSKKHVPFSYGVEYDFYTATVTTFSDSFLSSPLSAGVKYVVITNEEESHIPGYQQLLVEETSVIRKLSSFNPWFILTGSISPGNPLKFPLTIEQSWTTTSHLNNYEVNFSYVVISETETITIGDQTYNGCILLRVTLNYPNGFDWSVYPIKNDFYFKSGIGCIKRVDYMSDGSQEFVQVVSYNIQ